MLISFCFSLFENDRHFSHLSNLEREMTFRTEMGLYYYYFKVGSPLQNFLTALTQVLVTADSVGEGVQQLYRNNLTEFPLTINTLKRFNLYPELAAGLLYRGLDSMGMLSEQCWTVNRGEDLEPVQSCEGSRDPPNFYIRVVWVFAGLTTVLLFVLGHFLSGSLAGGLLPVICFFYNHGEATRVMWTPPLRESFAFPLCLAQILAVSVTTRSLRPTWFHLLSISVTTTLFIICWQFAQFMLFTQTCAVFAVHVLGLLPRDTLHSILVAQLIGLLHAVALMFGNEMLFTSWMFSCLLAALLVSLPLHSLLAKMPFLLCAVAQVILFFGITFLAKITITKAFLVQDDAHVFELLKSKFTDFQSFHTLLYTCAVEFDFLGWEMPWKTSATLLLPSAAIAVLVLLFSVLKDLWQRVSGQEQTQDIDPAAVYNMIQCAAYAVMAVLIMRLKLFFTPHLCLLTSLLALPPSLPAFMPPISRSTQFGLLVGLVAAMSVQGVANIKEQRGIMGEYQNVQLEQLIEWINKSLPPDAVLAGPMPTMANLLLSTGRPVVNHPHYEDAGLRERTKQVDSDSFFGPILPFMSQVYTTFSRRPPSQVHRALTDLKVEYLVLSSQWCLTTQRGGCALTEVSWISFPLTLFTGDDQYTQVWDIEEPGPREAGSPPTCPTLWNRSFTEFCLNKV